MLQKGDFVIWTESLGQIPLMAFEVQEVAAVVVGFTAKRVKIEVCWIDEDTGEIFEIIHNVTEGRLRKVGEDEFKKIAAKQIRA